MRTQTFRYRGEQEYQVSQGILINERSNSGIIKITFGFDKRSDGRE